MLLWLIGSAGAIIGNNTAFGGSCDFNNPGGASNDDTILVDGDGDVGRLKKYLVIINVVKLIKINVIQ